MTSEELQSTKLNELREGVLIKNVYKYFLIPAFIYGCLSLGFPLLFSLVPAHESSMCIC